MAVRLTLLLPPRSRFAGGALAPALGKALARADAVAAGEGGWRAQLQRHCRVLPRTWPVAALTRQLDAGDAVLHAWLRADPAHVRMDINAGRLLACGDLGLDEAEVADFLKPLKILFGDAGFPISAPVPQRWYLALPRESKLPAFADPEDVLGDDIAPHLPAGDLGRRWRSLLNEAQILLHNHPRNAERAAAGKPTVNSLWFWGGGVLPDLVALEADHVFSREVTLAALAAQAGSPAAALPATLDAALKPDGHVLVDLRQQRALDGLTSTWLLPAVSAVYVGEMDSLVLDFADGSGLQLQRAHRWRFWRRPLARLDA